MDPLSFLGFIVGFLGCVLCFQTVFPFFSSYWKRKRLIRKRAQGSKQSRQNEAPLSVEQENLILQAEEALERKQIYQAVNFFIQAGQLRQAVETLFVEKKFFDAIHLMMTSGALERSAQILEQNAFPDHALTLFWFLQKSEKLLQFPSQTRRAFGIKRWSAERLQNWDLRNGFLEKLERFEIFLADPQRAGSFFFQVPFFAFPYLLSFSLLKFRWESDFIFTQEQSRFLESVFLQMKDQEERLLAYWVKPDEVSKVFEEMSSDSQELLKQFMKVPEKKKGLVDIMEFCFPEIPLQLPEFLDHPAA